MVLALAMLGIPARAFGVNPIPSGGSGTSSEGVKCVDERPGPGPIVDRVGKVGVPDFYCYDPHDKDHAGWHDYCSFGQGDTWSKGGVTVSFKGSCAHHDLCLEYGWGLDRRACDSAFGAYMHRNCDRTIRHSKVPNFIENMVVDMCYGKAERMYAGVAAFTSALTFVGVGYQRGRWPCFIQVLHGSVFCGSKSTGGGVGGGGSWRSR